MIEQKQNDNKKQNLIWIKIQAGIPLFIIHLTKIITIIIVTKHKELEFPGEINQTIKELIEDKTGTKIREACLKQLEKKPFKVIMLRNTTLKTYHSNINKLNKQQLRQTKNNLKQGKVRVKRNAFKIVDRY